MGSRRARTAATALGVGLLLLLAGLPGATAGVTPASAPVPALQPIDGGIHGRPYPYPIDDLDAAGYVVEEFLMSGQATSYAPATAGQTAPYATRLLVIRPATPDRFNGSVLVEWNNVTGQTDGLVAYYISHEFLLREGYAYVAVSAQKAGADGPSPLALKTHDPVRYAGISHPGDDWSFDIFSQAGRAVVAGEPRPLGGLTAQRLVATGQSQSGSRLRAYLRDVHRAAAVYDGFVPQTSSAAADIPSDVEPVLWVNTETEAAPARADEGNFRLWEIAGSTHAVWWTLATGVAMGNAANVGPERARELFDRDDAAQYGERGGGPCPREYNPDRYVYNAAIATMHDWLVTGDAPPSAPRLARTTGGRVVRDRYGNGVGGVRLPTLEVPVASYNALDSACGLFGETIAFDPVTLAALYPTHASYVAQFEAAAAAAVQGGWLLAYDAGELVARAQAAPIGGTGGGPAPAR